MHADEWEHAAWVDERSIATARSGDQGICTWIQPQDDKVHAVEMEHDVCVRDWPIITRRSGALGMRGWGQWQHDKEVWAVRQLVQR